MILPTHSANVRAGLFDKIGLDTVGVVGVASHEFWNVSILGLDALRD